MILITGDISLDENEIKLGFIRASGPGGQNVNKVSTGVQLRFDVEHSPSLPDDIRQRLARLAGNRLTSDGVLVIDAHRFRTQEQNRRDALRRLVQLIRQAAHRPRPRRPTKPTAESRLRRLAGKRHRSVLKQLRRSEKNPDE
jgi:ribosome-associated protein